jgi:hypothetical protein
MPDSCSCLPAVAALYTASATQRILSALKMGHAFITFSTFGPTLEITAGEALMGDSVKLSEVNQVQFTARGLFAGDVVQMVTSHGSTALVKAESNGDMRGVYTMPGPGFAHIEILRSFLPGLPLLPALIANPIYFDAQDFEESSHA